MVASSPYYTVTETAGTANKTVVNTIWNQASCRKANPIPSWSNVSNTLIVGYTISVLLWSLNIIFGNNGGTIHMVYWRSTQAIAILPLLILIFVTIASLSYGTRTDVFNSWFGGNLSITGSTYTVTSKTAGWVSD
jgi:hypothetical protein